MDRDAFIERVANGGAFQSKQEVEAAAKATLGALGAVLSADERVRVARELPEALRSWLGRSEPGIQTDPKTFFARVGQAEGVRAGLAVEHAQAVGRVLAEAASDELVILLKKHLPQLTDALFRKRPAASPPDEVERTGHVVSFGRDLASGAPGSRHPVSTHAPDRAHSESVAKSDDPHAETKLSSARGSTQEREEETLADGKPPEPKRPLAGDD